MRAIDFPVRHPWLVIFFSILFCIVTWAGLSGIIERSDYKAFVDANYPGMLELEEVESLFGENNNVFITVAPANGDIFTSKNLTLIQELTEAAWLLPFSQRVDSLTNYQYTRVDGDELIVNDLVPSDEAISQGVIDEAKRVAPQQPILAGLFISDKMDVSSVNVTFQFAYQELLSVEVAEAGIAAYTLIDEFKTRYPDTQFEISGSVAVDYVSDVYHAQVSHVLMPAMLLLMTLLLALTLRSFWGTACTIVIVILTGSTTMGIFGWFNLEIDGLSAISPIVIMTLAVADSVHIITGVLNGMSAGKDKIEAIKYSIQLNWVPVFITSLTTVLGVITFTFTDFPPLKKLGLIIAVGVSIAFILSITLLPALLSLTPLKTLKRNTARNKIFVAFGEFVIRYYRKILPVSIVIVLGFSAFIPRLVIDESMSKVFEPQTEVHQAMAFITENLSGSASMDVAILSDNSGAINTPEMLIILDEFSSWARSQPEIKHVTTITDTIKTLNQNMHQDQTQWYKLPENENLAAQYFLLYEMSLPYGLDLNNQITLDKSGTRITLMMGDITSAEVVALKRRILGWFDQQPMPTRNIATSMQSLMGEISYLHLLPKLFAGGLIAIFTVSMVLFLVLRSWKLGLLGMLSNVVPIAIGYGYWAIHSGILNFASAAVAGVCLGIVVDFAVHFLNKFQQGLKDSGTVEGGVRYAFEKVASPLWTTMLVLASGFWVLTISPFGVISDLGLLTGVVIVAALLFNLLALPAFLLYFARPKSKP